VNEMKNHQNPKLSDGERIHSVYWLHLPEHTDTGEGRIGITHRKARQKEHRDSRRIPEGHIYTVLTTGLTRFEAAKMEYELRPRPNMGWNIKAGGGKFIRALMAAEQSIQAGLLATEYDLASRVARFTYEAGTEINATAIKAYCSDLTNDGPPREIEIFVGDQQIQI